MPILINQAKDLSAGTQYATVEDYFASVNYHVMPFGINRTLTVSAANVAAISSTDISGTLAIGANSTQNSGGVVVALNTGATIAGETTNFADALGYPANLCELRYATTNDSIIDATTGKNVYGFLQAVSTATDGDAIAAAASENTLMSFAYLSDLDVWTLVSITGTIEFSFQKRYAKRYLPNKTLIGKANGIDIIQQYTPKVEKLVVTAAYLANEVITLSTGAGAIAGTSTVTGITAVLPASAPLFASTDTLQVYRNGLRQEKGTEVIWDSIGSLHFAVALVIGEVLEFQV